MKKRDFIKNLGAFGLLPFAGNSPLNIEDLLENHSYTRGNSEKDFWSLIRNQYKLHPDFINLESGNYNIKPEPTLKKYLKHLKRVNLEGSYYMRQHRFIDKDNITEELASFVDATQKI